MVAILKFFILSLIAILALSALCGVIAFFIDLHHFKSEKDLSLPRKRLIQALYEEQEFARQADTPTAEPPTIGSDQPLKEGW